MTEIFFWNKIYLIKTSEATGHPKTKNKIGHFLMLKKRLPERLMRRTYIQKLQNQIILCTKYKADGLEGEATNRASRFRKKMYIHN
jgi:hypothetical protein